MNTPSPLKRKNDEDGTAVTMSSELAENPRRLSRKRRLNSSLSPSSSTLPSIAPSPDHCKDDDQDAVNDFENSVIGRYRLPEDGSSSSTTTTTTTRTLYHSAKIGVRRDAFAEGYLIPNYSYDTKNGREIDTGSTDGKTEDQWTVRVGDVACVFINLSSLTIEI